jgi:hypothetical protein
LTFFVFFCDLLHCVLRSTAKTTDSAVNRNHFDTFFTESFSGKCLGFYHFLINDHRDSVADPGQYWDFFVGVDYLEENVGCSVRGSDSWIWRQV